MENCDRCGALLLVYNGKQYCPNCDPIPNGGGDESPSYVG